MRRESGVPCRRLWLCAIAMLALGALIMAGSPPVEADELQTNWKLTDLYPDIEAWKAEAEGLSEYYDGFADRLPGALREQLSALRERLNNG